MGEQKRSVWQSPAFNASMGFFLGVVIGVTGLFITVKQRIADQNELVRLSVEDGQRQMAENYQQYQRDQATIAEAQKSLSSCQENFSEYTVLYDMTSVPNSGVNAFGAVIGKSSPLAGLLMAMILPGTQQKIEPKWLVPARINPIVVGDPQASGARFLWIDPHTGAVKSQVFLPQQYQGVVQ